MEVNRGVQALNSVDRGALACYDAPNRNDWREVLTFMKKMRKDMIRVMDETIASGDTPCALALLWRDGEEKFYHASGYADLGRNTPVERNTIFRLYSLTKPMTAVAAMTLVERGQLDIMAPVSDFLEGFRDQHVAVGEGKTVPVKQPMLVRDLFSMTSGLCYPGEATPAERAMARLYETFDQDDPDAPAFDTLAAANLMGKQPLAFQPGESWLYGTSADVLGAVIEAASGKALDEYMAHAVFEPLGMEDTGFFVPQEKQSRFATLYEHRDGMLAPYLPSHPEKNDYLTRPAILSGGGGAVSTMTDVLAFARMLLGGGELENERVLSRRSVEWLSQNHLNERQRASITFDSMYGCGYGGLMRVILEPAQSFSLGVAGEFGWEGWAGAYMTVCPAENMVLLVMQHCADSIITPLTRKIRNIVYSRIG